ncbi:MAG: DUF2892 domain-containing protein [Burkholderiales bacterium]|nr:DUF2892 domain-containing protein [Burkholderiales bacterium]
MRTPRGASATRRIWPALPLKRWPSVRCQAVSRSGSGSQSLVVPLATGLFGFCPVYPLLGLNTCPLKEH